METMIDVEDLDKKVKKNIKKRKSVPKKAIKIREQPIPQESSMVDLTSELKEKTILPRPAPLPISEGVEFINQDEFLKKMKNDKSL